MLETEKLVITPLAYIRGRSLQRIFFIVDEAQNLTPHEVKTIITRAGEGTKIVFTGDIHQIDHPYLDSLSNGLSYLINRMVGQPIYAHITLEKGERLCWPIWPASYCEVRAMTEAPTGPVIRKPLRGFRALSVRWPRSCCRIPECPPRPRRPAAHDGACRVLDARFPPG